MNKKKEILFNTNNFLLSVSTLFDKVEQTATKTSIHHNKRVAYLSLKIGQKFNLSDEQLFDLCAYALSHNFALYGTEEKNQDYCNAAQHFIKEFPLQSDEEDVLKYHLEYYDGSGKFGLKEDEIPLFSQIIGFANLIDTKFDLSDNSFENRARIIEFIKAYEEKLFSIDMSEIFCDELCIEEAFWLDLSNETALLYFIYQTVPDHSHPLSFEQLLTITTLLNTLIHPNSNLINHAQTMAIFYNFDEKDTITFKIAASLSVLGKLSMPLEFKTQKSLTPSEKLLCKAYPYETKMVLNNIMGFTDIASWATKVQECIDGSGYPYALKSNQLSFKDQLLGVLVRYEALTNKTYDTQYSHTKAIKILQGEAKVGKIDSSIVKDIEQELQ